MATKGVLGVASLGDPRDAGTWSGTPASVVSALERRDVQVLGIDGRACGRARSLSYLVRYQVRGAGRGGAPARRWITDRVALARTEARSDYNWARPARRHRGRWVATRAREAGCTQVLHMGNLTTPLARSADGLDHYLFCDSTWNTLHRDPDPPWRYSMRMLADTERTERKAFDDIRHFFPIAEYVGQDLVEHYGIDPTRITVVGSGRGRIEPFMGSKDDSDPFILFAAKVRFEEKGGPLLLEAFRLARQRDSRLRLVMVGDERHAQLTAGMPGVTTYGSVPWTDLQSLFHQAALFAMPATREPWGLVYLEALASKTPILGLARNAMPELTQDGDHGFLVEDADPEAVAEGLLDAFSDLARLRRMGESGQRWCLDRFSWDRVVDRITGAMGDRLASAGA